MATLQSQNYNFSKVPLMWEPQNASETKISKFRSFISKKYSVKLDNYWDLHKWSVENTEEFWAEMWNFSNIIHSKMYDRVLVQNGRTWEKVTWFEGARLNFAENVLKYKDNHLAIICTGEDRCLKTVTYFQLYNEAINYGLALKKCGLQKGDRVACYMSNREEAIFAMLGATALGGIWLGALPLSGAKAAITRFQQTMPKFLFTIDRHKHAGEEKEMLESVRVISENISSLEKVIIVPSKSTSIEKDISKIKNSCFLSEFLSLAVTEDRKKEELKFEQVPFDFPVFISFTSGTTGIPKALIHGCGVLLNAIRNYDLHGDGTREDVQLALSPVGWATWTMFATSLTLGNAIVLYEGVPFNSSTTTLWDLIDNYQITHILLTGSRLDEMEKTSYLPSKENSLTSLKFIVGASCVVKPQTFDFICEKIKGRFLFASFFGATEVIGFALLADYTLPIYKGETSAPALGVDSQCFNEKGESVKGKLGELVFVKPMPDLPVGIWGDKDGSIFHKSYFSTYPDAFCMKDLCLINPVTKGTIFFGRSDDTLKPNGTRFGSSEIYVIVEDFPEVHDSLCVSQYNSEFQERVILFLKMNSGHKLTEQLSFHIKKTIKTELSNRHVPAVILETMDIPYNMSGKKMENIVKRIINNMPYNTHNVINPKCLERYQNIPELKDF